MRGLVMISVMYESNNYRLKIWEKIGLDDSSFQLQASSSETTACNTPTF